MITGILGALAALFTGTPKIIKLIRGIMREGYKTTYIKGKRKEINDAISASIKRSIHRNINRDDAGRLSDDTVKRDGGPSA